MAQKKGQPKRRAKRDSTANRKAEEQTADLIDHRLTKALSHPLRCAILAVANTRTISPSEYAEESDAPISNVSYHFRKLYEYDCIEIVEELSVRGATEHRYRGCRRGLVTDANWKLLGPLVQAGIRIAGFQDLINRCEQAVAAETFDSREDAVFYWIGGGVDEIGWKKLVTSICRLINEVAEVETESNQRAIDGESECFPVTFAVLGFESPVEPKRKWRKRKSVKPRKKKSTRGKAKP